MQAPNSSRKDSPLGPAAPAAVPGDGGARAALVPGAAPAAEGGGSAAWPDSTRDESPRESAKWVGFKLALLRGERPATATVGPTTRHDCGYLTSWVVDGHPWCPACWWDSPTGQEARAALKKREDELKAKRREERPA